MEFIQVYNHCPHLRLVCVLQVVTGQTELYNPVLNLHFIQRFGISSSASLQSKENGTSQNEGDTTGIPNDAKESTDAENPSKTDASDQKGEGL